MQKQIKGKKTKKIYNLLILKIKKTPRNIFGTLTTSKGRVLLKKSCGELGYKGSNKTTPYVTSILVKFFLRRLFSKAFNFNYFICQYTGDTTDNQLNAVVNTVEASAFRKRKRILYIDVINKVAHNGVRPQKKSR